MTKKIILKGMPVSKGIAQGRVKLVTGVKDSQNFNEGDILVTKITDPTMVMMMSKAAAIICDVGGMTSHPSIVSREMGTPCIVNTKEGTTKLKDGMQVIVDGTKGEVYQVFSQSFNPAFDIDKYLDTVTDACSSMDYATFDDTRSWFSYDPLIAKSWTQRILKLIDDCQKSKLSFEEIGLFFPSISQLRNMMLFDLWMANYTEISGAARKKIFNFYTNILEAACIEDPHASKFKNVIHSQEQISSLVSDMQTADEKIAKTLGKIANICYHFGHAAYSDMNPSTCYEHYGSYDVSGIYGSGHIMVVKEFNHLRCPELWPETKDINFNRIHIVAVYENVKVKVDNISHVTYQGELIKNLKYYRLLVNGQDYPIEKIDQILEIVGQQAISLFEKFQKLDFEDRKMKYYHMKAYVYKWLYDRLGQAWQPSQEILNEAKNQKLFKIEWPKDRQGRWQLTRNITDPRIVVREK